MKCIVKSSLIGALGVGALLLLFSPNGAWAANTASGTTIGNKASVNYQVGGVDQTVVESSPTGNSTPGAGGGTSTDFKVDTKLILSVVTLDTALVTTVPGAASAVTTFKVQNLGNAAQSAWLTAVKAPAASSNPFTGSGSSDFVVDTAAVYADSNANGTYEPGTDTAATNLPTLAAAGGSAVVFVVASIPISASNDDFAVVGLDAQVGADNGAAITSDDATQAPMPGTVQQVFAETSDTDVGSDTAPYDGYAADDSGYIVNTATLTVTKTSSVLSDPISESGNAPVGYQPKAIPGAVVQYTITVANAADAGTATDVAVSDNLGTQITAGSIAYNAGSIKIAEPANGDTATACTDASDAPDKCTFASNTVSVSSITLDASEQAVITFDVTIQ